MALQESQLAQAREASTNAVSVYSPGASTTAIIREIWLANTTANSATFSIFCDDNGTTYDQTTALVYLNTLEGYESRRIPCYITMNDSTGNLGYQLGTASAITITVFGVEIT